MFNHACFIRKYPHGNLWHISFSSAIWDQLQTNVYLKVCNIYYVKCNIKETAYYDLICTKAYYVLLFIYQTAGYNCERKTPHENICLYHIIVCLVVHVVFGLCGSFSLQFKAVIMTLSNWMVWNTCLF